MKKLTKIPMPTTLNDCYLLYQMGYETILKNGKVQKVRKMKKWMN